MKSKRKLQMILVLFVAVLMLRAADSYTPVQEGWRWCSACQSLFYGLNGAASHCPRTRGPHTSTGSGSYLLHVVDGSAAGPWGQRTWFWCRKCGGLYYGGNAATAGECPRDNGWHESPGYAAEYSVRVDEAVPGAQSDWAYCNKCRLLYFTRNQSYCPRGGGHDKTTSGNYKMIFGEAPPRDGNYRLAIAGFQVVHATTEDRSGIQYDGKGDEVFFTVYRNLVFLDQAIPGIRPRPPFDTRLFETPVMGDPNGHPERIPAGTIPGDVFGPRPGGLQDGDHFPENPWGYVPPARLPLGLWENFLPGNYGIFLQPVLWEWDSGGDFRDLYNQGVHRFWSVTDMTNFAAATAAAGRLWTEVTPMFAAFPSPQIPSLQFAPFPQLRPIGQWGIQIISGDPLARPQFSQLSTFIPSAMVLTRTQADRICGATKGLHWGFVERSFKNVGRLNTVYGPDEYKIYFMVGCP